MGCYFSRVNWAEDRVSKPYCTNCQSMWYPTIIVRMKIKMLGDFPLWRSRELASEIVLFGVVYVVCLEQKKTNRYGADVGHLKITSTHLLPDDYR